MFNFENGTLVKGAYVVIDGIEYEVHMPKYIGNKPLSAENLNKMQKDLQLEMGTLADNIDEISKTEFRYTTDIGRTPNGENGYLSTHKMDSDYSIQEFTSYDGTKKFIRAKKEGVWSEWSFIYRNIEKATLQLQNSWAVHSDIQPQIYRDARLIHLAFIIKEGTSARIANLPEGFRPENSVFVPATNLTTGKGTVVYISSDGNISCESADVGVLLTVNATLLAQ